MGDANTARGTRASTGNTANTVIESLGVYLPPNVVTTEEVVRGARRPIQFPLEKLTGIRSRRVVGEAEYAIDLARNAVDECLRLSKFRPEDIDLVICATISRCEGPDGRFSIEPSTAVRLAAHFGFVNALAFDISNACAGMFTAINIVDGFLQTGAIRTGLVVSGEYISHLTRTAQLEIEGLMDLRLPCLTLGDAGAAVILERVADDTVGFHDLDMFTLSRFNQYCVARPTDQPHGGAIMFTDMIGEQRAGSRQNLAHIAAVMERNGRSPDDFQYFLTHQISRTSLMGTVRQVNQLLNRPFLNDGNLIDNLAERGNTATTTHFVALYDYILDGRIKSGDNLLISTTGSGVTLGVALYTFDDLPDRLRAYHLSRRAAAKVTGERPPRSLDIRPAIRVRIESVGTIPPAADAPRDSVELIRLAAEDCLARSAHDRSEIGLFLYAGVHRTGFVFEPAIGTLAAGELRVNDLVESMTEPRTFVFDVFNGAIGFLNACAVAEQLIEAGKYDAAMVVASEIDNNRDVPGKLPRGVAEVGSALLLDRSPDGRAGFGRFLFHAFPEHVDGFRSSTAQEQARTFVAMQGDPHPEEDELDCIVGLTRELLALEELSPARIAAVFPPQHSSSLIAGLSRRLEIAAERFVDVVPEGADLYTSSLSYALRAALDRGMVAPGDVGLIIGVAAGIQVGCAIYHF